MQVYLTQDWAITVYANTIHACQQLGISLVVHTDPVVPNAHLIYIDGALAWWDVDGDNTEIQLPSEHADQLRAAMVDDHEGNYGTLPLHMHEVIERFNNQ